MSRTIKAAMLVGGGATVLGVCIYICGPRDLVYPLRSYQTWLRDVQNGSDADLAWRAAVMLRKAGTNVIPAVLAELTYRESPSTARLRHWADGLPLLRKPGPTDLATGLPSTPGVVWVHLASADERHMRGIRATQILGPEAKAAVPLLSGFFMGPETRDMAAAALAAIGPLAVPFLRQSLTNRDAKLRSMAAAALGWMESEAATATLDLLLALRDPDESVRCTAIAALGSIRTNPAVVVPALISRLQEESRDFNRVQAADALGRNGPEAKAAFQPLLRVAEKFADVAGEHDKPGGILGESAIVALNLIDPEAAERAGFKAELKPMEQDIGVKGNVIYESRRPLREALMPPKPAKV